MRFQTDKESREKTMNKILKQVKTDMKNISDLDEKTFDKLKESCCKTTEILYEYMLKSIDFSEKNKSDNQNENDN